MKIEKHFSIAIPNKEAEKIITVQDYYDVVAGYLNVSTTEDLHLIQQQVNKIIADHAGYDVSEIWPNLSITSDLGLD